VAAGVDAQQILVEKLEVPEPVQALCGNAELAERSLEELSLGQDRVEDKRGVEGGAQPVEQGAAERGLARADLAGKADKALSMPYPVQLVIKRLGVLSRCQQIARVRRYVEGLFSQAVIVFVH